MKNPKRNHFSDAVVWLVVFAVFVENMASNVCDYLRARPAALLFLTACGFFLTVAAINHIVCIGPCQ